MSVGSSSRGARVGLVPCWAALTAPDRTPTVPLAKSTLEGGSLFTTAFVDMTMTHSLGLCTMNDSTEPARWTRLVPHGHCALSYLLSVHTFRPTFKL